MNSLRTLALAVLVAASTTQLVAARQPVRIVSAQDVLSKWRPDRHVYVKGDVGISVDQLAGLESWLDEHGPHWVVVLMEDADQESYRAADGRTYHQLDAVEHALGHGLSNRTGFGHWEDPRTKESDGAVLAIFLKERNFSYFGSDAHDRRGLGESHWVGELDRPAFRAMRAGMRVADAVKGTVTNINGRLQQTIDREEATRLKEQQVRKLAVNELTVRISAIEKDIAEVDELNRQFCARYPAASGELTEPPLARWRDELSQLDSALTNDTVHEVSQTATSLQDRVAEYLNAYAADATYDDRVRELTERLERLESKHDGVARATVIEARELIEQAAEDQAAGRFEFMQRIQDAHALADRADEVVKAETARRARQKRLQRVIRMTATATGLLILAGLGVLGVVLNRKRRPQMEQAQLFFEERKRTVAHEVDRVFQLLERSGEVLGSIDRVKVRGYEGLTRQLSEATFDNVDDLIVMSSEVERVMGEAAALIHPTNPLAKTLNMFGGFRFQRGLERISGTPLQFQRDHGLPLVLAADDAANRVAAQTAADGHSSETIQWTFEEVFQRFHDRSDRATETLDRIERCLLRVNDGLNELQADIEQLTLAERDLAQQSVENEYFTAPACFDLLIPAAQKDFDAADALSVSDPVTAIEIHIHEGARKTQQAMALIASIRRAHIQLLPQLRQLAPQLEDAGYAAHWIDDRLMEMTQHADQLFAQAAVESIAEPAVAFDRSVDALDERAKRCWEIAGQLTSQLEPSEQQLKQDISGTRVRICSELNLPADKVLDEKPRDPDDNLTVAGRHIETIKAALQRGNVEAASEAVTLFEYEIQNGNQAIQDTITALDNFDSLWRIRQEEIRATGAELPGYQTLVASARVAFAANTWVLQAVDPTYPDVEATIDSHLDDCQTKIAEDKRLHGLSDEFFKKGRVLEATAMLDAIGDDLQLTQQNFQDLDQHIRSLEQLSRDNANAVTRLAVQIDRLRTSVSDRRTRQPTLEFFQQTAHDFETITHEVKSQESSRDPLGRSQELEILVGQLEQLDARVAADRKSHAEAERAVESAATQLTAGQRLIRRARQDDIPDSRATSSLVQKIKSLDSTLHDVRRRLEVPHDDWQLVHEAAMSAHKQLAQVAGSLSGELQLADQAVESLERAARDVFQATKWTGDWGVRILGTPGSNELERARAALQGGQYNGALELSRAASMMAGQAIQKAEREVARRQRDELRRAEARRRQRSTSVQAGGWSGQRSSGSSGRISSGSSRSSSNSGFSRSGW